MAEKFRKLKTDKDVLESRIFPVLLCSAQARLLSQEETKRLETCQRKVERRILHFVWKDKETNADIRLKTNMKDIVAAADNLNWKWGRPCGKNGAAHAGTRFIAALKNRQRNWATEDPMGRHVQERSRR